MRTKLIFPILLIVLFLQTGCAAATPIQVMPSTSTVAPTLSFTPTQTIIPTPVPSETPVVSQKISQACVEMVQHNQPGFELNGTVVFDDLSSQLVRTILLRDLEKSTLRSIAHASNIKMLWGISPNRRYLLYEYDTLSSDEYYLAITNASGQTVKEFDNVFPNDPRNATYYNWQNDENIRVVLFSESQEGFKMSPRIYNPFTGDYRVLKTDFPDYVAEDLDWRLDWIALSTLHYQSANIVYDPSLTRVLYPKRDEIVSLADAESNGELASVKLPNWGRLPKWSPDSNYLAIIGTVNPNSSKASEEIFVVQRDGSEFKQLTHFSNTFEQSAIADYGWSPDGRHIAFWSYTDTGDPKAEKTQSELMLLDVQTGEVIDLCIQGISAITPLNDVSSFDSLEPIWSPDGNQIMISQWEAPEDEKNKNYSVLLIDVPSLTAVKIDANKQPAGWMTKQP